MTEREKFEAEYRKRSDRDDDDVEESLRLGKDGEYLYDGTWTAFYWWQAARAKSPKVAKEVCSPTKCMTLGERIKHVGGRENEAGYIEFGSVMAVHALINHVLRDVSTIPDGMALVPVEPTDEMIAAFWGEIRHGEPEKAAAIEAYKAMLAATKEKGE